MLNMLLIVSSLKYLRYRFMFMTKLSVWIHKLLIIERYSEFKMTRALAVHDIDVIKMLISLSTNDSIFRNYVDEYCTDKKIDLRSTNIMKIFYLHGFQYKKELFVELALNNFKQDIIDICEPQLLNKLLDKMFINKNNNLCILLLKQGAVLDKLTFEDDIIVYNAPSYVISLLTKTIDQKILYRQLENIIKTKTIRSNITYNILSENSFLRDQNFFNLVVKYNLEISTELFLQNGFDPDSVKVNENTKSCIISLLDKYRKWKLI